MRLHRLSASAFGPFGGSVALDLEMLSSAGLFLIHGPTGSGKTSLLDAICFALYANVPGERLSASLRSQHADESVSTAVELELTLRGRRLRITRHPAYERPKKRGHGTTTEPARVHLEERRVARWETLSTRIDETALVLDDLLGMGLEQFRRVVMLPQGNFAAFLRSTDEERREVLERLFDITDYTGVEGHLVERRQRAESQVKELRARLGSHVAHLVELLSNVDLALPEPEHQWSELSPTELLEALAGTSTVFAGRAAEVMALVDVARREDAAARAALEEGRRLETLRARGAAAHRELAALEGAADQHAATRRRLDAARSAAEVLPLVQAHDRSTRAHETSREAHARALTALPETLRQVDAPAWAAAVRQLDEVLTAAHHDAQSVSRLEHEAPLVEESIARQTTVLTTAQQAVVTAGQDVVDATQLATRAERARTRVDELAPRIRRLERIIDAGVRLAAGEDALRDATDLALTRREQAQDCRSVVQDLVTARLENMAGELAAQLRQGDPCAVCGSRAHPRPARAARVVTAQDVADAQEAQRVAEAEHERAKGERATRASRVDVTRAEIDELVGDGPEQDLVGNLLEEDLRRLRQEQLTASQVAAGGEQAAENVRTSTLTLERAHDDVRRAEGALAGLRARRDQLGEHMSDGLRRLTVALSEHAAACPCQDVDGAPAAPPTSDDPGRDVTGVVEPVRAHHERVLGLVDALIASSAQLERTDTAREEATMHLAQAMDERDFPDAQAVLGAVLDRRASVDLQTEVDEHERALSAATAVLAEPDVVAAMDGEAPDVEALALGARQARSAADEAERTQATTETVQRQFARIAELIGAQCRILGPAAQEAALVRRMADLVTGTGSDNDKRMRLSTYVLAARLERIVELANDRLTSMADGRYELVHDDASARGQRRGGLGLLVHDLWTDRRRATSTLSGGESFTVSLALALGLADAIREESGGAEFGTLFVDEGFGSLDQESLEQVLDVLDRLRDGGRAVGLVSHVSEMRTRIATRVRVDKSQTGSTVRVVGAGDPGSDVA